MAKEFLRHAGLWYNSDHLAVAQTAITSSGDRKLVVMESGTGKSIVAALCIAIEAALMYNNRSHTEELFYLYNQPGK